MSCSSEYVPQLRSRGFRMTPQRMAVLHVLRHASTHMTPSEVYKQARHELPRITEPTVYRTLDFLAENGLVRPSHSVNGHMTYEIAGDEHHHLICRSCGDQIEVEHALLANFYGTLEKTSGYRKIDSHLTFFGICPTCSVS